MAKSDTGNAHNSLIRKPNASSTFTLTAVYAGMNDLIRAASAALTSTINDLSDNTRRGIGAMHGDRSHNAGRPSGGCTAHRMIARSMMYASRFGVASKPQVSSHRFTSATLISSRARMPNTCLTRCNSRRLRRSVAGANGSRALLGLNRPHLSIHSSAQSMNNTPRVCSRASRSLGCVQSAVPRLYARTSNSSPSNHSRANAAVGN